MVDKKYWILLFLVLQSCAIQPVFRSVTQSGTEIYVQDGMRSAEAMHVFKSLLSENYEVVSNNYYGKRTLGYGPPTKYRVKSDLYKFGKSGAPPIVSKPFSCHEDLDYEIKINKLEVCETLLICVRYLGFGDVEVHDTHSYGIVPCTVKTKKQFQGVN